MFKSYFITCFLLLLSVQIYSENSSDLTASTLISNLPNPPTILSDTNPNINIPIRSTNKSRNVSLNDTSLQSNMLFINKKYDYCDNKIADIKNIQNANGIYYRCTGIIGFLGSTVGTTIIVINGSQNGWKIGHTTGVIGCQISTIFSFWRISLGRRMCNEEIPNIFRNTK